SEFLATLRIPQPAGPVDVNSDGVVNDRDLYLVWAELLKPSAQRDPSFDLDGDGVVNAADLSVVRDNYLTVVPRAGPNKSTDVNGDSVVNDLDLYTVWQELLKSPAARDGQIFAINPVPTTLATARKPSFDYGLSVS